MPWHTPDAKIETILADYLAQAGGPDLSGIVWQTRYELTRNNSGSVARVVCDEVVEWEPGGETPVVQNGNWTCAVSITLRTPCKRKDLANRAAWHDSACGRIADLLLEQGFVANLNEVGEDEELQVIRTRLLGKENEIDDDLSMFVSGWTLTIDVVPNKTGQ